MKSPAKIPMKMAWRTIDFLRVYEHEEARLATVRFATAQHRITRVADLVALPTEFVVAECGVVTPRFARVYETDLFRSGGEIGVYEDFRALKANWCLADGDRLLLFEVWEDEGSDGHVDYQFQGVYRFGLEQLFHGARRRAQQGSSYDHRMLLREYFGRPEDFR